MRATIALQELLEEVAADIVVKNAAARARRPREQTISATHRGRGEATMYRAALRIENDNARAQLTDRERANPDNRELEVDHQWEAD